MTKKQIIELIKAQEISLYQHLQDCLTYLDQNDEAVSRASASWYSVHELLEKIEGNENN